MQTSEMNGSSDPLFTKPYIDIDEWRDEPLRHRYIHGGFEGTDALFSIYFPPKEQYDGRFFQYIMAISGNEKVAEAPENPDPSYALGFVFESGAYFVESNLGRKDMFPGNDPTITGYRTSAAVANYSRVLASEMYGPHRPYGYAWGGSGGGYKTISCIESTNGVWDGVVPFIHASPMAMINVFSVQAHAMRILKDKIDLIIDAVEPGGNGDIYAGLNEEEREALTEVTKMGFPPRAWFNYQRIAFGYTGVLTTLLDIVIKWDPTYFEDFWKISGYLGANPPESLLKARLKHETTISKLIMPEDIRKMGQSLSISAGQAGNITIPAGLVLESVPDGDIQGASIFLKSGKAEGHVAYAIAAFDNTVMLAYGEENYPHLADIQVGDKVLLDNSNYLAAQTYHRHQVPGPEYKVWDQFRDANGKPIYPQRPEILGPRHAEMGSGSVQSGKFEGKMIAVNMLMDEAAYPWQPDWYRSKVKEHLGDQIDDYYRLWYFDNAMHTPPTITPFDTPPMITTRIINYGGILQQALRDVSAWAEKGIAPPLNTVYKIVDGQVEVPPSAVERKGIQPVIDISVNGGVRADVNVGDKIEFSAIIEVPPNTGSIVNVEWDFEGAGDFPLREKLKDTKSTHVEVKTTYSFAKPGTYFPSLRATSNRQGNPQTPYAKVQNIGRVRVVVTSKEGKTKEKGKSKGKTKGPELITEINKKPSDFQKFIDDFAAAVTQKKTVVQGNEISNVEIKPRSGSSLKFQLTPFVGEAFYTISFENTDTGIATFLELELSVQGSYKMFQKAIKKGISKKVSENTIDILNDILK